MAEMTKKDLVALLKKDIATKERMLELRAAWKDELGEAVSHFDVHPKALNFVRWVYRRLETHPQDVVEVLDQIDLFCGWLNARERAAAAAAKAEHAVMPHGDEARPPA
jgi:hypothetical protein